MRNRCSVPSLPASMNGSPIAALSEERISVANQFLLQSASPDTRLVRLGNR
jgi:hypothetical protein